MSTEQKKTPTPLSQVTDPALKAKIKLAAKAQIKAKEAAGKEPLSPSDKFLKAKEEEKKAAEAPKAKIIPASESGKKKKKKVKETQSLKPEGKKEIAQANKDKVSKEVASTRELKYKYPAGMSKADMKKFRAAARKKLADLTVRLDKASKAKDDKGIKEFAKLEKELKEWKAQTYTA